jgi:hypothetical protein
MRLEANEYLVAFKVEVVVRRLLESSQSTKK